MPGGVFDVAIGLLPHFEKPVSGIARIGVVGEIRALERKWTVGQIVEVRNAGIEVRDGSKNKRIVLSGGARGQQV